MYALISYKNMKTQFWKPFYLYCKEEKFLIVPLLCAHGLMIPKANYNEELLIEFKHFTYDKLGCMVNISKKIKK